MADDLSASFLDSAALQKLRDDAAAVPVNADGSLFDLIGAIGFAVIETGIDGFRVIPRHLPERVLDNTRSISIV